MHEACYKIMISQIRTNESTVRNQSSTFFLLILIRLALLSLLIHFAVTFSV